jgi:hypothetical protein
MTVKTRTTLGMETPRSRCRVASSADSHCFLRTPLSETAAGEVGQLYVFRPCIVFISAKRF